MQPNEVAKVLTAIASVDDRIDPDEMRIVMWYEILHRQMTYEFAKQCVVEHYATSKNVIMPSDLNLKWKSHYAKLKQKEFDDALQLEKADAVAVPEYIKQQMQDMFKRVV